MMPLHVRCLVCRCMLSAHNSRKPDGKLNVDYAYCERCYHEEVRQLEATLASYRVAVQRYKEAQSKDCLLNHARQAEFLASGWKTGPSTYQGDPLFSDVLLIPANGCPVQAHKAVLAGRSPVFRAMFSTCTMREAINGVVMMEDMGGEALTNFVGFFYTASVSVDMMQRHVVELLNAAEKYDVALLRTLCEHAIVKRIAPHNAISTLELARMYGSQVLWAAVLDFVSKDVEHLPAFEEYQAYAAKDPGLLLSLYEGLVGQWMLIDTASPNKRSRSCMLVSG